MVKWKIGPYGFFSDLATSRPDTYEVCGLTDNFLNTKENEANKHLVYSLTNTLDLTKRIMKNHTYSDYFVTFVSVFPGDAYIFFVHHGFRILRLKRK